MSSRRASVLGLAAAIVVAGCGSDGASAGSSSLALRAVWQGNDDAQASGTAACPWGAPQAGLGDTVPAVVQRLRIVVEVGDYSCCVAFDPHAAAVAHRRVVLTGLPAGRATVTLSGYATDQVPDAGAADTCGLSDPVGFGEPCGPISCNEPADPSCDPEPCRWQVFTGAAASVQLTDGQQSSTGTVTMCAEALVVGVQPPCASTSAENPVPLRLTVAAPPAIADDVVRRLAADQLVAQQVDLDPAAHVCPADVSLRAVPVEENAPCICNDPGGADLPCGPEAVLPCCAPAACSDGSDDPRAVSGIVFSGRADRLLRGCARAGISAPIATPPPPTYAYGFRVGVDPPLPSPTATPSATPTGTVTATATATATITVTATATATATATPSDTPSTPGIP